MIWKLRTVLIKPNFDSSYFILNIGPLTVRVFNIPKVYVIVNKSKHMYWYKLAVQWKDKLILG